MVKISKDVPFNGVAGTNVWYGQQETQNKNDYLKKHLFIETKQFVNHEKSE